ncbi:MAG: hypothetical protein COA38_04245 [Fluviicola sp.]|nr:MAG: hypothetical protein COA38_04245 [Fluviicola sp.]
MKHLLLYSLSACLLFSCAEEKKNRTKKIPVKSDALIIGDPLDCGLDSLLIFPLGSSYYPEVINPEKRTDEVTLGNRTVTRTSKIQFTQNTTLYNYDKSAAVEYVNENAEDYDIRNLLFYDMYTQKTHPLVLDSLHILSFALHKEYERDLIFFRVVKKDYNEDKKYNSLDPVMLYISDLNGQNFTQITPENEQFIDYTFYKETQSIMIKTIVDSDKNKSFLANDETSFSSMKILDPKMAKEIFSDDLKKSLRSYLK